MTIDQSTALWCLAVPIACVLIGSILSRFLREAAGRVLMGISWWTAILVALAGRAGFAWWPEDAWQRVLWPLVGWAACTPLLIPVAVASKHQSPTEQVSDSRESWRWLFVITLAMLTAMLAMPSSEAWSDTFRLHRLWIAGVALSCAWNGFAIESMARRGAARWCLLVGVAGMGGPLVLAAATYGSLAEWALAVTVATLAVTVGGLLKVFPSAWMLGFAVAAAAAVVTSAARLYTWEDYPAWVYLVSLFTPLTLGSVDFLARNRGTLTRVTLSALVAVAVIGMCAYRVLVI